MDIRDATASDVEAIHAIYCQYVRTSIATLAEDEPLVEEMLATIQDCSIPFIVGVDVVDKRVCGYAYGTQYNANRSGYRNTVEDSVYLDPKYVGKGRGQLLLRVILERLKATGKTQVIAKISILPEQAISDSPSCRLHMSLGFQEVGRLSKVGLKHDKLVDVVIFQLNLDGYSHAHGI